MDKLFEINNLRCSYAKHYKEGESKVVLEIESLVIPKGKKVFIVGESGIGKSTILETLGMMNNTVVPSDDVKFNFYDTSGQATDLVSLWHKGDKEISDFRLKHFNFIFQSTNLMRNFTVYENVALTRMLQGYSQESSFEKARKVMEDLGLDKINETRMPHELSGGQQQRVAFARAILPDFTVLFGDEPTGNLDSDNAVKAMELLTSKLEEMAGSSAIIVSHDMHLAVTFADVIIKIHKYSRERRSEDDDVQSYGKIDEKCVFLPSQDKSIWSNGSEKYTAEEFEQYLKKM